MTLDSQSETAKLDSSEEVRTSNLLSRMVDTIRAAKEQLLAQQQEDGHWVYELEADCTIPAEYILMNHFVGDIDDETELQIATYLRDMQDEEGGWPLFTGGNMDLSCTVKAYYALKLVGDDPHEEHMVRARNIILNHGGAANSNVFTRITMALFGQVPCRSGFRFILIKCRTGHAR